MDGFHKPAGELRALLCLLTPMQLEPFLKFMEQGDEQVHRRRGYLSGGGPEGWGRGVRRTLSLLEHVFSLCAHRCLPLGNTLMDKF